MRHQLMTVLTQDDGYGNTIHDSRSINWNKFIFPNGYLKHVIAKNEILKPYLISYKYYKTIIYEDFILLVNNISNPFDLREGIEIKIPKLDDIKAFVLENKK